MQHFYDGGADQSVRVGLAMITQEETKNTEAKLLMKIKVILTILIAVAVIAAGCSKPANTNTKNTSNSNAKAVDKKAMPAAKIVPVPANWIDMVDEQKGYGFKVPEGTGHSTENSDGIDVFMATTPEPSSVSMFVMAFKDQTLTKADLLKFAEKFLEGMKETNIKIGDLTELSDDYSLATISSVDEKGKVTKGKVLVATDVNDNYVMLLGTPEAEYKENEKIIDEIWGSFTMRSGGASGAS
jgi:hypothetical protein